MAYEMIVGLQVKDSKVYQDYRDAMKPILELHGGGFRYDFLVKETLKSMTPEPINRVFAIYFESKSKMEEFFSNSEYKKIKEKYFVASVESTTLISSYERSL